MRIFLVVLLLCLVSGTFVLADNHIPIPEAPEIGDLIPENGNFIFGVGGVIAVIIPVIIGVLKKYAKLPKSICPITAVIIGIVLGVIVYYLKLVPNLNLFQAVLAGAAIGGSSTGIYSIKKYAAIFLKALTNK